MAQDLTQGEIKTGTYDQAVVQDKFMYVLILSTLESIFKSQHVGEMLKKSDTCDSRLRDICDGSLLKTHPLFSTEKHTVQIQMFYDDFEVANPLGSKRDIHKLGAVYFTLRNFSPKWNSFFGQHTPLCLISCTRSETLWF